MSIELKNLSYRYENGQNFVLKQVNLSIERGHVLAIAGKNGSGKTTLIKLMSGVLKPSEGQIHLDGSTLGRMKRREVAQQVAVVPQQFNMPFAFTLREVVLLGRTPFLKPFSGEGKGDNRAVDRAIALIGIDELKGRFFNELSGGERQKAILALALAQEPKLLLLDEPTAHLDINHQVEVLELIRKLNRERGLTVLATMHDLNLASLYFDRLILLNEGRIVTEGSPRQVLSKERVEDVFRTDVVVEAHPTNANVPHIVLLPMNRI